MVRVSEISWISKAALEAEVSITDGDYVIKCFCHPCNLTIETNIESPVYCMDNRNVVRSPKNQYSVEKLPEPLAYLLTGKILDRVNSWVKIGDILVEIEEGALPGDILDNDFVSFYAGRINIY